MPTYRKPLIREQEDSDILLFNRIDGQRILVAGESDWQDEEMVFNAVRHAHTIRRIDYIIFPGHEHLYQEDGKDYPVTPGKSQEPESHIETIFYSVAQRLQINTSPYELAEYPEYGKIYWYDRRNAQMVIHATSAIIFCDEAVNDNLPLRNLIYHLHANNIPFEVVHH